MMQAWPFLLTRDSLSDPLQLSATPVLCLDSDWETIATQDITAPDISMTADDLAYVIYTSGSTGQPKGVQIPHRAVVNFLSTMRKQPGITADDTLVAVTTLSFDIAVLELYLPLTCGARVVLASREVSSDGNRLAALMTDSHCTVMQATPATWQLLLDSGWNGQAGLRILCGGEALPRQLADRLLGTGADLWNMYGPTETTIWSSVWKVADAGPVLIGRPIGNTRMYVVDDHMQPLPIGVPGELCIGGDGLARGYLHRPELTAEKFIPDPFSDDPQARLYRTGDLARFRPDGTLECLGRTDFQVKLRGFRIELGEIEELLDTHPDIDRSVVVFTRGP